MPEEKWKTTGEFSAKIMVGDLQKQNGNQKG